MGFYASRSSRCEHVLRATVTGPAGAARRRDASLWLAGLGPSTGSLPRPAHRPCRLAVRAASARSTATYLKDTKGRRDFVRLYSDTGLRAIAEGWRTGVIHAPSRRWDPSSRFDRSAALQRRHDGSTSRRPTRASPVPGGRVVVDLRSGATRVPPPSSPATRAARSSPATIRSCVRIPSAAARRCSSIRASAARSRVCGTASRTRAHDVPHAHPDPDYQN